MGIGSVSPKKLRPAAMDGGDVRGATGSGWIESYVFTSAVTSCGSTFMYISAVHAWPGYFFRMYVAVVIIITFIITFPRAFMCTK